MLKAAGCLCILVGCIGWGGNKIRDEKRRIRNMQELVRIIRRIQNEIDYGKHTLPEICLILSEYSREPFRECFKSIYERTGRQDDGGLEQIWMQETIRCMQTAYLQDEEQEILRNLPQNLGLQGSIRRRVSDSLWICLSGNADRQKKPMRIKPE